MMLKGGNLLRIGGSILGIRRGPIYVQFYVTARCNLTCKQCNIIYANASVREATTEEIDRGAENLRKLGTTIVLLTGGEPFARKDLAQIVRSFTSRGIHVRTQTNGLATDEQLTEVCRAGARDISISLDSLNGAKQDFLNGSHRSSWKKAIETVAKVTRCYPKNNSFAAFGTVLSPQNILEIPNIIRFATRIGWYVSLVPAHISTPDKVLNFRSYDREMIFPKQLLPVADRILDECLELKRQGYNLYDSKPYLEDIKRFIRGKDITWRRRNDNVCDSPRLYFAIRPNGDLQVCCDHNLARSFPFWHEEFPNWYRNKTIHNEVIPIAKSCGGCMYGSYPEVSITAHFPLTGMERLGVFWKTRKERNWPFTENQLFEIIDEINSQHPVDDSDAAHCLESLKSHAEATVYEQTLKSNNSLPIVGERSL